MQKINKAIKRFQEFSQVHSSIKQSIYQSINQIDLFGEALNKLKTN